MKNVHIEWAFTDGHVAVTDHRYENDEQVAETLGEIPSVLAGGSGLIADNHGSLRFINGLNACYADVTVTDVEEPET